MSTCCFQSSSLLAFSFFLISPTLLSCDESIVSNLFYYSSLKKFITVQVTSQLQQETLGCVTGKLPPLGWLWYFTFSLKSVSALQVLQFSLAFSCRILLWSAAITSTNHCRFWNHARFFSHIIFIIGVLCLCVFATDEHICLTLKFFKPLFQSGIKGECYNK